MELVVVVVLAYGVAHFFAGVLVEAEVYAAVNASIGDIGDDPVEIGISKNDRGTVGANAERMRYGDRMAEPAISSLNNGQGRVGVGTVS